MKARTLFIVCLAALNIVLLPSSQVHSQLLIRPGDPATALQALQQGNADLLKRQEATLKDLDDMMTTAHEMRLLSARG